MTGRNTVVGAAAPASGAAAAAPWEAMAGALASLPDSAVPDPAVIASLANALFSAPPGGAEVPAPPASLSGPGNGVAAPSFPAAVVETVGQPGPGVAAQPALGLTPPSIPAGAAPDPLTLSARVPLGAGASAGGVPGSAPASAPSSFPLADPFSGAPGDPGLAQILRSLGPDLALTRPGVPAPGAAPTGTPGAGGSYYFLDLARGPVGGALVPATPAAAPAPQAAAPQAGPAQPALGAPELPAVPTLGSSAQPFNAASVRHDFPILQERVNGRRLVWLDNAATTQKPQAVIDRLAYFYQHENSNIHRAAHTLAARATDAYEAAREKVRRFLGAGSVDEIIFVRGATEGINLIAQSWGRRHLTEGDEIVISWLEHHANIVPWQQLAAVTGAKLKVAPVDDSGQVILEEYERLFTPRTRLASFTQVSNALGTVTPAAEMVAIARRHGACVVVDGAQAVSHMPVNVQALDCDFYVLSGHKMFGPTGIGVVYGKKAVLEQTPPWQGGGNMIADVTFEKTLYQPPPAKFEAGTGNIADAVGLGAAIDYVERIGMSTIARYEHELLIYATDGLLTVPGLTLIGTAAEKAGVLSFVLDGCRTEDVGKALSQEGIAVRSGHHCAQPILRRFGLESTVRPSLAFYNTTDDIDALVQTLHRIASRLGR